MSVSYKLSIASAVSALFFQTALAQELATVSQTDFSQYDCDVERDHGTRHVGQYIQGQYMEWLESYGLTGNVRYVLCVSLLQPTTGPLSQEEAEDHYSASAGLSQREGAQSLSAQAIESRIIDNPVSIPSVPLGIATYPDTPAAGETQSTTSNHDIPSTPEPLSIISGNPTQGKLLDLPSISDPEQTYFPEILDGGPLSLPKANFLPIPPPEDNEERKSDPVGQTNRERPSVDAIDDRERITAVPRKPGEPSIRY